MKIRIICGTYGYRPNKNESRVVSKNNTSEPFEVDDDEARRLVELGIAEICDKTAFYNVNPDAIDVGNISVEQIMSLEYNQMKKIAKEWGIDAKGTKDELRERLIDTVGIEDAGKNDGGNGQGVDDAISDNADPDGVNVDGETPPELRAQMPE